MLYENCSTFVRIVPHCCVGRLRNLQMIVPWRNYGQWKLWSTLKFILMYANILFLLSLKTIFSTIKKYTMITLFADGLW